MSVFNSFSLQLLLFAVIREKNVEVDVTSAVKLQRILDDIRLISSQFTFPRTKKQCVFNRYGSVQCTVTFCLCSNLNSEQDSFPKLRPCYLLIFN